MRILMTTDTVSGVWNYSIELVRALAMQGTEVCLAALGRKASREQRAEVAALGNATFEEHSCDLVCDDGGWPCLAARDETAAWLVELEGRVEPDVLQLNSLALARLRTRGPHMIVAHSCPYAWSASTRARVPAGSWERFREVTRAGLREAGLVVAPTAAMLTELERSYGRPREAMVIPNGREARDLAYGPKEQFVLVAGRLWDEAKNLRALDEVAPGLPWPVWAAGSTEWPDGRRSGFRNVKLLGNLPESVLSRYLAAAPIYAHPARFEPFGLTVLEAAAHGCALVLGDIPSLRENWDGAALFVDPLDRDDLRETILYLIRNPKSRDRLAARALERSGSFTSRRMGLLYVEAYHRISAPYSIAG